MTARTLLLIDPNPQTLSQMEGQLRRQGYEVLTASNSAQALDIAQRSEVDLVISEFNLGRGERALDLTRRIKQTRPLSRVIMLIDHAQQRDECTKSGVDEILTKPIYINDLRDRVDRLFTAVSSANQGQQRFFGRLEEMGLNDLLQVVSVSQRSGMLMIEHGSERGSLWFTQGTLHDAEMASLSGLDALNRVMTWEFGQYEFDFNAPARPNRIQRPLDILKSEGMDYVQRWNKICEQLPPLETVLRYDPAALRERTEPVNSLQRALLDHFDGRHTILNVVNQSNESDLEALQEITRLYFEGLIYEVREVIDPHMSEAEFIDAPQTVVPPIPQGRFSIDTETISDELPLHFDTPPPPVIDTRAEFSEEGAELLAEMYSASASDSSEALELAPPPVPDTAPGELESDDEAYATLFGADGMFDYAEEEVNFFDEPKSDKDLELTRSQPKPRPKMSTYSKIMWAVMSLFIAAISAVFAQDIVRPLDITEDVRNHVKWTEIVLKDLPEISATDGVEGVWQIELKERGLNLGTMIKPERAARGAYIPTTLKPRKLKRNDQRKLSQTLKRALELKARRDKRSRELALEEVKRALLLQPVDRDALLLGAMLNLDLGEGALALSYLQPLLKLEAGYNNPEIIGDDYGSGVVSLLIGNALVELKRPREAVQYYESYLRDFPGATKTAEIRGLLQSIR